MREPILKRCDGSEINLLDLLEREQDKNVLKDYYQDRSTYLRILLEEIDQNSLYGEYLKPEMENVIDIGANVGVFSLFVEPYSKYVFAIEPTENHFTLLRQLCLSKRHKIQCRPLAISDKSGEEEFFSNPANQTSNSVFREQGGVSLGAVTTMTLSDFFNDSGITHSDFVKLDAEGAEMKILRDPSFESLNGKIATLYVEVHNINSGPLKRSLASNRGLLVSHLESLGYSIKLKNTDGVVAAWKQ